MTKLELANEKLEKMVATLERHNKNLEKKMVKLEVATDEHDRYWISCDITSLKSDIKNTEKKIAHQKEIIDKLIENENIWNKKKNIPEIFVPFKINLVNEWNEYDRKKKEKIMSKGSDYYVIDGKTNFKKMDEYYYWKNITDEKIVEINEKDAIDLICNLIHRCEKKAGNIISFSNLYVSNGNFWKDGGVAINGYVEGDKGKVIVESITAGGYNIQRLHIRVLVK